MTNQANNHNSGGFNKGRRDVVRTLGKMTFLLSTYSFLGGYSNKLYDNASHNSPLHQDEIDEAQAHLEQHGVTIYDYLMFANFSSAVYNLAQGEKSYIKAGEGIRYLYQKLPYSKEIQDYFAKFSNSKLAFLQEVYSGVQELIGSDIPHLDHEFPHAELATGLFLNLMYASQGEHEKEKVIHGLKETGIGVGLLVLSTIIGKAIRPSQPTAEEIQHENETTETIDIIEHTGDFAEDCKQTVNGICDAIGCQLIGSSLTQFPKTAYGSARSIGATMRQVLHLTQALSKQLEGKTLQQVEDILSSIENKIIKKILQTILNENKKNTEENSENVFTGEMVEKFVTTYSNRINIGLMSPSMDIGQAALGDLAPAVIGSYQSFGLEQAMKTCVANLPFSIFSMFTETYFMTSQRIGVPLHKLVNKENLKTMILDVVHTWFNLGKGIVFFEQNKAGSSYQGSSIIDDAKQLINGIFVYRTEKGADKLAAQIMNKLINEDNELEHTLSVMQNSEQKSLKKQGITIEQIGKLSSIMQIFQIPESEIEESFLEGTTIEEVLNKYSENQLLAAQNLDDLYDNVKQKMRKEGKDETEIEKLTNVLPQVEEDIQRFIDQVRDISPSKSFIENLTKIQELQNKKTNPLRMLTFDYWKEVVGAEIAETAFVVFLQGIHGVGLLPIFSSFMSENDMLIFTKYSGFSMVADNWLAQMTAAKEMAKKQLEVMHRDLEKEYVGFTYNSSINVIENFNTLVKQICEKRKSELRFIGKEQLNNIYQKFCEIKALSVIAGVGGGGESTIGNAPHFSAIVDELKKYMSLNASLKDIVDFPIQHTWRLMFGYVRGKYGAPAIETTLFKNPFIKIAQSTGVSIQ